MRKRKITILEINTVYLATALLLITIGAYVQSANVKSGLIITEYLLVLLPVLILLKAKNISLKSFLRFNRLRPKHGLIVIIVTLLAYPIAMFASLITLTIISWLGLEAISPVIPTANNLNEYIVLFLIIAVSAGICEEILFRGLISRVYEERYKTLGIILPAIMFGVFHFDVQRLLSTMVLGLVFGYLVHITNSIYAGIIAHITNNGFIVTLMYGVNLLKKLVEDNNIATEDVVQSTGQLLAATLVIGFIAVITGFLAYLLIKVIKKDMETVAREKLMDDTDVENHGLVEVRYGIAQYIPVLVIVLVYIGVAYLQFS